MNESVEVEYHGAIWNEANEKALEYVGAEWAYVHPFEGEATYEHFEFAFNKEGYKYMTFYFCVIFVLM